MNSKDIDVARDAIGQIIKQVGGNDCEAYAIVMALLVDYCLRMPMSHLELHQTLDIAIFQAIANNGGHLPGCDCNAYPKPDSN